jgi:hypothetical protein
VLRRLCHKLGRFPELLAVGGGVGMALCYVAFLYVIPSPGVALGVVGGAMLAVVLGVLLVVLTAAVGEMEERDEARQTEDDDKRGD